ncbi:hypothetical protein [Agrococcus jejuensis]|uniref:hypothetical protein n=1 Tax=Agrococcus jejuensis TaxID=399736 RepID=UPI000B843249|nr:hypothetical protein [Agrococcus jejuensis]
MLRAWWAGRIRRLVPRGVPWTAVAFTVVLLAAWALFADILLTPGVVQEYPGEAPSRAWGHDFIGWIALQVTFGLGAGSTAMLMLVSTPRLRWVGVAVTVASTAITLHLVLSGPGQPLPFVAGVAASGVVSAALAVLAALLPAPRVHLAVGSGFALAIQWGVVTWAGIVEPEPWVFLRSWIDLAFPVLLAVGFLAMLAVAVYAQQMHARADRIGRRILVASWAPIVAAAIALVIVLVRMGPLARLFGEYDGNLWGYATVWSSWPHAIVAGGLVVWLVARSSTRPLRPRGHVLTILVLAAMAGISLLAFGLVHVLGIVAPDGDFVDPVFQFTLTYANFLALAFTAVLLVPLLVPWFRRSTGRVGALVAIVVAVPLQLWFIMTIDLRLPFSRIAAAPSQIVLVILVAVLVLATWGAIRGRDVVDRHLLLRLAIVPLATAHAGQLLPGIWKDDFEQASIVVLSLVGLLVLGAPRTGTKEGNAQAMVSPFAAQVLVLGSVIVARTMGQLTDDETTTIAVLYMTIPIAAVLCCRLEDPSDGWTQRASTVDLQTMRRAPGPVVAVSGGWGGSPTGPVPQPWGGQPGPGPAGPPQQPWPPHPPHSPQPPRR